MLEEEEELRSAAGEGNEEEGVILCQLVYIQNK